MGERSAAAPGDDRIEFRIGVHQGDIVVEDDDIFGDGVNVAARLEGLAEPGGICVSARVQEDSPGKFDLYFEDIGDQSLKNIARPVRVYRVRSAVAQPAQNNISSEVTSVLTLPDEPSIAVLPFANMSGDPEQEYFADGMVEEIIGIDTRRQKHPKHEIINSLLTGGCAVLVTIVPRLVLLI
jgi:adenylate cyclase